MTQEAVPFDIEAIVKAGITERRASIEQIIHECPKLQGEPSRDCIAALSGVATHAARQAARAAIAAVEATLRAEIEAEVVAWLRNDADQLEAFEFCHGTIIAEAIRECADAIEQGEHRATKGQVDA